MTTRHIFILSLLVASCALTSEAKTTQTPKKKPVAARPAGRATLAGPVYARREDAMLAADDIAARRDLDRDWVRRAIGQARYLPQLAKLILPPTPGTPKNWRAYRSRFIEPIRIKAGVKFWRENLATLTRAEDETGVPAAIIVGIIGVETIYGRQMGGLRVIDTLSTLAFDFPVNHPAALERSAFFRSELEQFLSLMHRTGVDPRLPLGSYAGAMGMPQFMPSSWARYAVDYDGDSRIDLFNSADDVIGSVANYFKAFGWQPGMPTHYPVSFDAGRLDLDAMLAPDILPTFSVASLIAKGAVLDGEALQHSGKLALVELQNAGAQPSYVLGTENFYTITRYNWSSYYAMAVIDLGREIERAMKP